MNLIEEGRRKRKREGGEKRKYKRVGGIYFIVGGGVNEEDIEQ